jgi:Na+/melibiose symporter-like transporter
LTAIVAGIPIYFLFNALRLRSVAWFAAVGAGVGAALIHLALAYPEHNWYPAPVTYAIGALCGSASAAMFWFLGVKPATPNNALEQTRGQ